ncbi:molybdopterin-dependent oxidoreductase, partial [Salmonella enterica subsp. enterica serovar Lubbock]|nr:molybdopterin-dependent oxidoreductase [Salmonella enterica subsp. enterica serovar Lubbock]
DYTVQALKSGAIRFACEQPDSGHNHPRNLFVWRSNLLGSSGKRFAYGESPQMLKRSSSALSTAKITILALAGISFI